MLTIPEAVQAYFLHNIDPAQLADESIVTGLMIEHFSQWLLVPGHTPRQLQPA